MLTSLNACRREEPVICRTSPPERSEDYRRWADAVAAAHCKNFRLESSPAAH